MNEKHEFTDAELEAIVKETERQVQADGKLNSNLLRERLGIRLDIVTAVNDIFEIIGL